MLVLGAGACGFWVCWGMLASLGSRGPLACLTVPDAVLHPLLDMLELILEGFRTVSPHVSWLLTVEAPDHGVVQHRRPSLRQQHRRLV